MDILLGLTYKKVCNNKLNNVRSVVESKASPVPKFTYSVSVIINIALLWIHVSAEHAHTVKKNTSSGVECLK